MRSHENIPKIVTAVLLFALLLRLVIGIAVPAASMFRTPEADRMMVYGQANKLIRVNAGRGSGTPLKPGRPAIPDSSTDSSGQTEQPTTSTQTIPTTVKPTVPTTQTAPSTAKPTVTTAPTTQATTAPTTAPTTQATEAENYTPRPGLPTFTAADTTYTSIYKLGNCLYNITQSERATLLQKRLTLDLDNGQPTVLIVHTHATECFSGDTDKSYAANRNPDNSINMVSIGEALKEELEKAGIVVIHDTKRHDYYNYDGAYTSSRSSIQSYLDQYPSIQLVLDLHRDAFQNDDGSYGAANVTINGEKVAQVMMYVGTNSQKYNPNWRTNLALALQLQATMEKQVTGITRNTMLSGGVYNQDLCTPSILIECGSAGNTRDQVLRSIPYLAEAIIALANGTN